MPSISKPSGRVCKKVVDTYIYSPDSLDTRRMGESTKDRRKNAKKGGGPAKKAADDKVPRTRPRKKPTKGGADGAIVEQDAVEYVSDMLLEKFSDADL